MKNILIIIVVLAVIGGGVYWYQTSREVMENTETSENIVVDDTDGKLKAAVFTGKLEEVNTGCFADGECYVVVDGKHVTTTMGWSQEIVGSVITNDTEGFGGLEQHIGEQVEVYAQDKGDGTYTLYGSTGFYVKLQKGVE